MMNLFSGSRVPKYGWWEAFSLRMDTNSKTSGPDCAHLTGRLQYLSQGILILFSRKARNTILNAFLSQIEGHLSSMWSDETYNKFIIRLGTYCIYSVFEVYVESLLTTELNLEKIRIPRSIPFLHILLLMEIKSCKFVRYDATCSPSWIIHETHYFGFLNIQYWPCWTETPSWLTQ